MGRWANDSENGNTHGSSTSSEANACSASRRLSMPVANPMCTHKHTHTTWPTESFSPMRKQEASHELRKAFGFHCGHEILGLAHGRQPSRAEVVTGIGSRVVDSMRMQQRPRLALGGWPIAPGCDGGRRGVGGDWRENGRGRERPRDSARTAFLGADCTYCAWAWPWAACLVSSTNLRGVCRVKRQQKPDMKMTMRKSETASAVHSSGVA